MEKKYVISLIFIGAFLWLGTIKAATNCDSQPKPVLDCPPGYAVECIPSGGDHWECGKEVPVIIIELPDPNKAPSSSEMKNPAKPQEVNSTSDITLEKLPAVANEATGENAQKSVSVAATVNVSGWDSEKREVIVAGIKKETENNSNITSVDMSEDDVALHYLAPAKLFGFIPMNITINVAADKEGKVKVKFPWYRFLLKTNFSHVEQEANAVFQNNQTSLEVLKSEDSAARQLEILQAILSILKTK